MLYQNNCDRFTAEGKTFTVGGGVFANGNSEYMGLFGTVTEIRTGDDRETDNDTPDIYCAFQPPEDQERVYAYERHFSALYRCPKKLDEVGLDCVIMAPDMLEPIPAVLPEIRHKVYSLSRCWEENDSCGSGTLVAAGSIGLLLRWMQEDLKNYEKDLVLSRAVQTVGGFLFTYETKEAESDSENLSLYYVISETPVLSGLDGGMAA